MLNLLYGALAGAIMVYILSWWRIRNLRRAISDQRLMMDSLMREKRG